MTLNRNLIKDRPVQIFALLLLIQLYLIFEQILPAYAKIPYYRSRIETSRQEIFNLEVNHDHLAFYQAKREESRARMESYKKHFELLKQSGYLQGKLNSLCQANNLEVINQQFDSDESNPDLVQIAVSLSLKGKYAQLSSFLGEINKLDPFITISNVEMNNQSPLALNPSIVMNTSLVVYLLKIS